MESRIKVELRVLNISNSQSQIGAYALLMGEAYGDRRLPIIIGASEAQAIIMELKGLRTPRPLTHDLFASVLEVVGIQLLRVLLYKVEKGVYYSYLFLKSHENLIRVDARTSDAVALALRMNAPIYIYEDILDDESLNADNPTAQEALHQDIPTAYSTQSQMSSLTEALQKAVEKEDYEEAAKLRDMINQLKEK